MLGARRLGRVFDASQGPDWMVSHATYCAPLRLDARTVRIFIVARDAENRGLVGYVDVDARDPRRVIGVSPEPVLRPGGLGAFDDRGISIGSIARVDGAVWLYYMGWNKSADVPFRNAIGLAIARDGRGERFERAFAGPLVDRSRFNPFTISYPFVTPGAPGQVWSMLHGTSRGGGAREEEMDHVLTEAISRDGIDWTPTGEVALDLKPGEFGLSRPWIVTLGGRRFLLVSVRRAQYTIGVAVETEGGWRRIDDDLLGASPDDWDKSASCYPATLDVDGTTYLFYSGDGYGRTGFGVAVLEARAS